MFTNVPTHHNTLFTHKGEGPHQNFSILPFSRELWKCAKLGIKAAAFFSKCAYAHLLVCTCCSGSVHMLN